MSLRRIFRIATRRGDLTFSVDPKLRYFLNPRFYYFRRFTKSFLSDGWSILAGGFWLRWWKAESSAWWSARGVHTFPIPRDRSLN